MYEQKYHGYCNKPQSYQCNISPNQAKTYHSNCYIEHKNSYTEWQNIPYPNEYTLPIPETPNAGNWPLCFLMRGKDCDFKGACGEPIDLNVKDPHQTISIQKEFSNLLKVRQNLTKHEIDIAKYWGDGPPTKQFMPIADILIDTYGVPACLASRILYILNGALNDTLIVTWKLKFTWNIIRPCQFNENFKTVLCTPKHPSYPAGHSSTAACMYEILSYFFPQEKEKLYMLATQCSQSRVYAGVHYQADCDEGFNLGLSIGQSIVSYINSQVTSNCLAIDVPMTEYRNANIIPYNLNQYIPFKRTPICTSCSLLNTNENITCYTTQGTNYSSCVTTNVNSCPYVVSPSSCSIKSSSPTSSTSYLNKAALLDYYND